MTTAELETDLVVLPDSDEAASYQSVDGWVSRRGHFYGEEEQVARWAGATHVRCEDCGSPVKKHGLAVCVDCWEKRDAKRWEAMPRKEWDGEQMVFSQVLGEFFSTPGDALDEAEHLGLDSDVDLRLVLCDPVHLRRLEIEDFADDLPEGGESPDWLVDAIDEFNEATDGKDPVCWRDGKFAMASAGQQEEEAEPTHYVCTKCGRFGHGTKPMAGDRVCECGYSMEFIDSFRVGWNQADCLINIAERKRNES